MNVTRASKHNNNESMCPSAKSGIATTKLYVLTGDHERNYQLAFHVPMGSHWSDDILLENSEYCHWDCKGHGVCECGDIKEELQDGGCSWRGMSFDPKSTKGRYKHWDLSKLLFPVERHLTGMYVYNISNVWAARLVNNTLDRWLEEDAKDACKMLPFPVPLLRIIAAYALAPFHSLVTNSMRVTKRKPLELYLDPSKLVELRRL
jgi:hypothetical protein